MVLPPYNLDFTYTDLNGVIEIRTSTFIPNKTAGTMGTFLYLPYIAGHGYKDTGVGTSFLAPGNPPSDCYFISAKVDIFLRGVFLAFYTGYFNTTATLRLKVTADGKTSTTDHLIWKQDGPAGVSMPMISYVDNISTIIKASPQSTIEVMVEAVQTLTGIGLGAIVGNSCIFAVKDISILPVPNNLIRFPFF